MKTTVQLKDLYAPVQHALEDVRTIIRQLWLDALALVRVPTEAVPDPGGKLLRPALCLLSAGAIGGRQLGEYARLAASFEALHIASLAHDDVIDRALLRRGSKALNALWDNHAAVLGGDYLVARSVEMLATYDSCPIVANAIKSVRRMAEGELFFFGRDNDAFGKQDCVMLAEQKTASLFAEACSAPAYLIDLGQRESLHRFGTALGIAFQIIDDLLDVTQPAESLGKPACGDVVEGKKTLPLIYAREAMSPEERRRLDALRDAELTEADRDWITGCVERTGARERTESDARSYANDALACLAGLAPNTYRESMEGLVEFVLVRGS